MEHACVSCDTTIQAQSHSPRKTYSSPVIHIFQQLVEGPWHNTQPVGLSLSTDLHAVGVLVRAVHGTLVLSIALGKPAGGGAQAHNPLGVASEWHGYPLVLPALPGHGEYCAARDTSVHYGDINL